MLDPRTHQRFSAGDIISIGMSFEDDSGVEEGVCAIRQHRGPQVYRGLAR